MMPSKGEMDSVVTVRPLARRPENAAQKDHRKTAHNQKNHARSPYQIGFGIGPASAYPELHSPRLPPEHDTVNPGNSR